MKRPMLVLAAYCLLAPAVASAAGGAAPAGPTSLTLVCQVLSVHGDGSQVAFRRKLEITTTGLLYKQSDDHGAGYQIVGNGTVVSLGDDRIVLRDDKTIYWAIARDGSYYLKNHVTDSVQMGKCAKS